MKCLLIAGGSQGTAPQGESVLLRCPSENALLHLGHKLELTSPSHKLEWEAAEGHSLLSNTDDNHTLSCAGKKNANSHRQMQFGVYF